MSLITKRCSDLENYITNKLLQGDTVYVYSRLVNVGVGIWVREYIATSEDSETPPGATLDRIETPERSSVYDGVSAAQNATEVYSGPTVLCPEDC